MNWREWAADFAMMLVISAIVIAAWFIRRSRIFYFFNSGDYFLALGK